MYDPSNEEMPFLNLLVFHSKIAAPEFWEIVICVVAGLFPPPPVYWFILLIVKLEC